MRYIDRDENGKVTGSFARKQFEGQESVSDDHSDLKVMKNINKEKEAEGEIIMKEINEFNFQQAIARLRGKGKAIKHH